MVIEHRIIWDSITLVEALDSLHDDFEMTTTLLLHSGDKNIEEIQQIVTSTKVANMARQTIGQIVDLAMQMKKRLDGRQQQLQSRQRTNKKCFNYRKRRHYVKDCCSATKRKFEDKKASKKLKQT